MNDAVCGSWCAVAPRVVLSRLNVLETYSPVLHRFDTHQRELSSFASIIGANSGNVISFSIAMAHKEGSIEALHRYFCSLCSSVASLGCLSASVASPRIASLRVLAFLPLCSALWLHTLSCSEHDCGWCLYSWFALRSIYDTVSHPKHPKYGQYLTPQQVFELTNAPAERVDAIVQWLISCGVNAAHVTQVSNSLRVQAPVEVVEKLFGTQIVYVLRLYDGARHPCFHGTRAVQHARTHVHILSLPYPYHTFTFCVTSSLPVLL